MQTIIVDKSTQNMLHDLPEQAKLCAADGRILGYFLPALEASHYRGIDSPTSAEELRRREAAGGGRSLKEILADLERHA